MPNPIFEGIEINEGSYELPNGKKLRIVPPDIFQSIEFQKKAKSIEKDGDTTKIYKEFVQIIVVDDDLEPYLTKKELNLISKLNNGNGLFDICKIASSLSGVNKEDIEETTKK